ncbi:phosphodiester glycosidase family protein [Phormidium sp. CLA17]|uniref:phosphodiester glycosidase family protein n=1 Tax=Leptolyngbya sp. Cla-17 TaxID=2803751 RepID=UPI0014916C62|nr:phosphodiester glycosidase family protein [Leptolyngbya sp. Cla-17]MBM0743652.1 phosphodiester glycosidase family protein [Leptolyngbya sp. Cla-17]
MSAKRYSTVLKRRVSAQQVRLIGSIVSALLLLGISSPSQALATVRQGTQISLNGQTLSAPWSQWQDDAGLRIGISDRALTPTVGIQLLTANTVTQQPIQWFTPPQLQPSALFTRLISSQRYLDITDMAAQSGWQMKVADSALQITSPVANMLAIRQGHPAWGDRIVIELDRSTPWQTDSTNQEVILTLNAQVMPNILQQMKNASGKYFQSVSVESLGNQTRVRLRIANGIQPRIWSLAKPDRIIVDIRPDSLIERNVLWAPGLRSRQQTLAIGTNRVPVTWLELDPRHPGLSLKPIVPNLSSMMGIAPLAQTAQQAQVTAAINGGFFNRIRQLPLGAVRVDGRWLSGPILNRGAIAWDGSGNFAFKRLTLQETLTTSTGQRLAITHLNSGYIQAGIARYTADWGATYTSLSDNELIISVQNNGVVSQQPLAKAGSAGVSIPSNGYLLVLRSNQSIASALAPGTLLQLDSSTDPQEINRYPYVLGAGPLLIQNSQIVLNSKIEGFSNAFAAETAPRSAIAQTNAGQILLVTAYEKLNGSALTLTEMAQILQQLGAINALNLDGGSSTTLYLGGQVIDRPPNSAARVHNGIGIFLR